MIIGITGLKHSGKSTATTILQEILGYEVRSFATKLKEMICLMTGCTMANLEDYDFKENAIVPQHLWAYCSNDRHNYRSLLQGVGDLMRSKNPNIFIDFELHDNPTNVIISDCRMLNEAKAIKEKGGVIVRIERKSCESNGDSHKSETELNAIVPDYLVDNNGSIKDLANNLNTMTQLWRIFDKV